MALRVNPVSVPIHAAPDALKKKLIKILGIKPADLISYNIVRESIDARKKSNILYTYMVDCKVKNEIQVLKRQKDQKITLAEPFHYAPPVPGGEKLSHRPVIIGTGPAGLFAGLLLAEQGYRPILLERGKAASERKKDVDAFWEGKNEVDPESNVSFGEGGAGTFSDGKLNTLVKDANGRNHEVLKTLVRFGADEEILRLQKPHIGTDRLIHIVESMRNEIIRLGGEVRFQTCAERLEIKDGSVTGIHLKDGSCLPCEAVIAAIGHSARDTFHSLLGSGIQMEPKAFAVGLRIQHPQRLIDISQYGEQEAEFLSPAPYKLTAKAADGRGVYSFCMCPGGYVVNASSERGMTAVNGMSYHGRNSENANSALIVTVTPEDFGADDALAGIRFQQKYEEAAFKAAGGRIPVQLLGDFAAGRVSRDYGDVAPCFRGQTAFADLNTILPKAVSRGILDAMEPFDHKIHGFMRPDAILAGIESRTSSPVRIPRNESFESPSASGLYPCGEGAGYAGGITSAAMDGLRVAEAVIRRFRPSAESSD